MESAYSKDQALLKSCNKLDKKLINDTDVIPNYTPFVEEKNFDRSTLFRIRSPFEMYWMQILLILNF